MIPKPPMTDATIDAYVLNRVREWASLYGRSARKDLGFIARDVGVPTAVIIASAGRLERQGKVRVATVAELTEDEG